MGQSADVRLTPEIAHEVCERTGSAAVLESSIRPIGNQYVFGLRAKDCRTGELLDEEQMTGSKKGRYPEYPKSDCRQIQNSRWRVAHHDRAAQHSAARHDDALARGSESLQYGLEGRIHAD